MKTDSPTPVRSAFASEPAGCSARTCVSSMAPIIPGHQIVGRIDAIGAGVKDVRLDVRARIPWPGHTRGSRPYGLDHRKNLCDYPVFTKCTRDGSFATSTIADARFTFHLARQAMMPNSHRCFGPASSVSDRERSQATPRNSASGASARVRTS